MSLVSTVLSRIGYRLGGGITLSTTSDPKQATVIEWINETALWLTGICAEQASDLGRTIGSITTVAADISAATQAANCQITATAHGLISSGTCEVLIKNVVGMTELNDHEYTFTYVSADAGTLGISSSAYTPYTSGGYVTKRKFSTLSTAMYCPAHLEDKEGRDYSGWIVDGHSRNMLTLVSEGSLVDHDPLEATEPASFYIDGSNNVCFPSYPDDAYTIEIPYYQFPTVLTASGDTMPFLGLFDNVFVEDVVIRAQNREEYELGEEKKWRSFLMDRALRVIAMRKKTTSSVRT